MVATEPHLANEVDQELTRLHLVHEDDGDGALPDALLLVLLHHELFLTPPAVAHADEVHRLPQLLVLAAQLHVLRDERVQRHDAVRVYPSSARSTRTHDNGVVRHLDVVAIGTPLLDHALDLSIMPPPRDYLLRVGCAATHDLVLALG